MADSNTPTSSEATKLISLTNLETYTGYVERKSVPVTREQYTALPSTKLTDGISYFITDEGIIIKNGVSYGASTSSDTTYSLGVGTGDDANKIILTPSSGTPDKVTVPYATTAGSADNATTVNNHTVASDVPADAVFTDNNTTYGLSVGTGDDANKIVLTPSTGTADKITVPYASNAGTVNGHSVAVDVPSDAEFTDTTYEEATTSTAGLLSSADKTKLNNLGTAAYRDIPTSGNASTSEVVLGTDTRLTDARNAADVYDWAKASTKPSYTANEVGAIPATDKGANNGVAELDSTGKVPSSQLPSYVDDVLEYNTILDFPITGETGRIYIAKDTNKTYRWSGTTYVEISESLALGETSSTAYAGNKGKANADAIAAMKDGSTIDSFGDVESALADKVGGSGTSGYIAKFNGIDSITNGPQLGSSTTTFLRNDGTWDTPPNDNTTYSLSVGSGDDINKIILTPSSGTADKITVPYATNAGDSQTVKGNEVPVDFEGTQDEWNALTADQRKSYDRALITDDYDAPDHMDADEVDFSNTGTTLSSTDVQNALVELATTEASSSVHGLMSASDKSKLDGIAPGATANIGTVTQVKVGTSSYNPSSGIVSLPAYPTTLPASNTTDTYSSTGSAPTSGKAVNAALQTLDVTGDSNISARKTIFAWSETDGKVSISTQDISITKSQVSDFPTLGPASAKNYTTAVSDGSTDLVTSGAVYTAIESLPEPMIFKGSLGEGGTITTLPVDGTATVGDTYKVITAGTYAGLVADVGDTFICSRKTSSVNYWELIPSGDEPSGTVTSIKIEATSPIAINSSEAITTSGTRTISHAVSGVTPGSYGDATDKTPSYYQSFKVPFVRVDATGHVTEINAHNVTLPAPYVKHKSFYGSCATPSDTSAKIVQIGDDTGWELRAGTIIGIKFLYSNEVASCTLNVEDTGDKSIYYDKAVYTGSDPNVCGSSNDIIYYMYNGQYWVWLGIDKLYSKFGGSALTYVEYTSAMDGSIIVNRASALTPGCTTSEYSDYELFLIKFVDPIAYNNTRHFKIYYGTSASATTTPTYPDGTVFSKAMNAGDYVLIKVTQNSGGSVSGCYVIDEFTSSMPFVGTTAEWNSLTTANKKTYGLSIITDD